MYERFTDRARWAMRLADEEAGRLNHDYVGTEHLLLGIVKEGSGIAANVLTSLGIDLRKVRLEVEKLVPVGEADPVIGGKRPPTPALQRVFDHAAEEARKVDHHYIGTEHLLLGLLREQDGVAAQVLMNLGLRVEDVRRKVLRMVGGGAEGTGPHAITTPGPAPAGADLYAGFTGQARRAVQLAHREAQRLNQEYVGTEHLLLGVLREG